MSSPSISVMKCGTAFSFASHLRQSYSVDQKREFLNRRQLHTLGLIGDSLLGGPACRLHAAAKVDEIRLRNVDVEGADGVAIDRCGQRRGKQIEGTCGG